MGAVIGGLFIGFFSALLILWKRSKPLDELELEPIRPDKKSSESCGLTASPIQHASGPSVSELDQFLALPTSNKDLVSELRSLGHLIEQHVEDNYHLSPVSQTLGSLSEALADLGLTNTSEKGVPGAFQLASMAVNPEKRHIALQHVIARFIFGSISVDSIRNSFGKFSLLPSSLTSVINHMAPCEKHLGSQKGQSAPSTPPRYFTTLSNVNFSAVIMALTRWRQLSVFLLNFNRSERGSLVPDENSLRPQARELVVALNTVLGAFVHKETGTSQEEHLQEVALECAKFGHVILSQPVEYIYQFGTEDETEVIVCPGLEKVSDEHGVRSNPEMVAAPERHKIDPVT